MSDELRVTVVATGLNRVAQQQERGRGGFSYREPAREAPAPRDSGRAAPRRTASLAPVATDYANFEKPAVQRFARAVGDGMSAPAKMDEELLDIPAFLRRQAD
jgi:hypothetical protein